MIIPFVCERLYNGLYLLSLLREPIYGRVLTFEQMLETKQNQNKIKRARTNTEGVRY